MVVRKQFARQLERLNEELIEMGALCEQAIAEAAKALFEDEATFVSRVHQTEGEIDQKERDIESLCMKMLIQQQPVASDLRLVSSALKMVSDMERIGDQAADIADIARHSGHNPALASTHIKEMAERTACMVTDSVDSFVRRDCALAREVMRLDDAVDERFGQVRSEITALLANRSADGAACLDLLMIAKYFERIGDHAVNIAEWVEYAMTGEYKGEQL